MKYLGSKRRIVKDIIPIIMEGHNDSMVYWEPFVGGGNSMQACPATQRVGTDSSMFAIEALIAIRDGLYKEFPDSNAFTEEDYKSLVTRYREYKKARDSADGSIVTNTFTSAECWLLHIASFGGKLAGGWARGHGSDYITDGFRNAEKQAPLLQDVSLCTYDYLQYSKFSGYYFGKANLTIYCDPPYEGATGYGKKFDHPRFWRWCRDQADLGNRVFISEHSAPDGFDCVWEKDTVQQIDNTRQSKQRTEKLFVLK